jgi:hypothetical protein
VAGAVDSEQRIGTGRWKEGRKERSHGSSLAF